MENYCTKIASSAFKSLNREIRETASLAYVCIAKIKQDTSVYRVCYPADKESTINKSELLRNNEFSTFLYVVIERYETHKLGISPVGILVPVVSMRNLVQGFIMIFRPNKLWNL